MRELITTLMEAAAGIGLAVGLGMWTGRPGVSVTVASIELGLAGYALSERQEPTGQPSEQPEL